MVLMLIFFEDFSPYDEKSELNSMVMVYIVVSWVK